jgi:hypothetical protein
VERIATRLKLPQTEFRKVEGYKSDEWNTKADRLAVQGRDEPRGLPKCSFTVQIVTGTIRFKERAMSSGLTIQELWIMLQGETSEMLRDPGMYNVFKDRKRHQGLWDSGLYEFKLKNTPTIGPEGGKTKALVGHMTTGREEGRGKSLAISRNIRIAL